MNSEHRIAKGGKRGRLQGVRGQALMDQYLVKLDFNVFKGVFFSILYSVIVI